MKRGNSYLTPVIITTILSSSLSQNSPSFADLYVHVLVQCGHKYRTRLCALSFANYFVLCFWNILFFILFHYTETFFLRNAFSEVTFCLEREDFFPNQIFVCFSEVMFIFVERSVTFLREFLYGF